MLGKVSRFIFTSTKFYASYTPQRSCVTIAVGYKHASNQVQYLKSAIDKKVEDWNSLKKQILDVPGSFNQKNIDGVVLKLLIGEKRFDVAQSFADHLLTSETDLNLGATNGLLLLYTELSKTNPLPDDKKQFILNTYNNVYAKYKVPDSTTCERLLHALCAISEWKKALKVLEDIYNSGTPTHSAYSTLIATLFRSDRKTEALDLIEKSIRNRRPLLSRAYEEWINYILRKYKDKNTIVKYLNELCLHVSRNFVVMPEEGAEKLRLAYESVGWNAKTTKIRKVNGQCTYCRLTLNPLKLSDEEFQLLQDTVKDRLIVGSDLFLKTHPDELKKFLKFVEETAPYDIVLDALNVSFAIARHSPDKIGILTFVVEHFRQENKRILLLGRKHMLKWPKMKYLLSKTCNFFTDNLSQDDPYFISATILSGPHTDFVSRDMLRGHRFQLQSEQLRHLFQRWQWQHQWKVFINRNGGPIVQSPLPVTPCAQRNGSNWHLPFERADAVSFGQIKDGTPDWSSWLCLQPPANGKR